MPETKHEAVLRSKLKGIPFETAAAILGMPTDKFLKHPLSGEQLQHIRKQAKLCTNGK